MPTSAAAAAAANPVLRDLADGESALTFAAAPRHPLLSRDGRGVHVSAVHRWASRGVRNVRLEWGRSGGVKVTTPRAIVRFLTALSADAPGSTPGTPGKAAAEVARVLDAIRIK